MSDKKASVLIVDDHPLFRERLCQLINNEPDLQVCGEAETAENAVHLVHAARPDLAKGQSELHSERDVDGG
jgi:DNA-binding NarL/FixJ family response regulator